MYLFIYFRSQSPNFVQQVRTRLLTVPLFFVFVYVYCYFSQPEPDFSYSMFDHGLTELFVGAPTAPNMTEESIQGDDVQQVI